MRLAFLGTPDFAVPALAALLEGGHEIVCVYSQPPAPRGRGQALQSSPVQVYAEARGLVVRTPASLRDPAEIADFAGLNLDAAVVVAFGQILPAAVLEAPRLGCFNLHASLLPRWRGAAPIQRAIMAGDVVTGVAVMQMTEGLDEGPVLASQAVAIAPLETAGSLHDRLAAEGAGLLQRTLRAVESGRGEAVPQSTDGVTYARKIRAKEARIIWRAAAQDVDRRIRGLSPFPGAWFELPTTRGPVRVKALLSRVEPGRGDPGEVLDEGLLVACGEGAVRLLRVQREGRATQDAETFLRGQAAPPRTRLS